MRLHCFATATALVAASLGHAQAATLAFDSTLLPSTPTDWSSFADLQRFDPTLGTLTQVSLSIQGDISGSAAAENRNRTTAATLTLKLQAELSLARPDDVGVVLVSTAPLVSQQFAATRFDAALDYGGTSGITVSNLTATSSNTASFSDASTLALFTGQGSVLLPFAATGRSRITGGGNLAYDINTFAAGRASVTYVYEPAQHLPPVPEPATWALLLAGMVAVGWKASRRNG